MINKKLGLTSLLTVGLLLTACTTSDNKETEKVSEDTKEDASWSSVEEEGVLTVGTSGTYAPITFLNEENELTGFEVELVRELGEELGVEVEFETMQFDGLLPALRNGQIDVAANDFAITEERKEIFDFVDSHKYSYGSAIIRTEDDGKFESAYDLKGAKIGLGSLTSNYATFAENIGGETTAYDAGVDTILRDILNGNQDAYLNDRLVLQRNVEEFGDDGLMVDEDVKYHSSESALAVLKGNTELRDKLSEALATLKDEGRVSELSEEFLGADSTQPVDQSEVVSLEAE
ncbi:transporter substrate-binding domain-containing protein [Marinilactibacillus psychrotolerans]|uniref:Amino acid ABC transporter substrate-binding protein n=1 Tax=Marinilactibacillus psychrotolerans TaxID=191770 RepID=A0AAV3W8Y8_9LACT|nr:transporter substrate-binding domain-containing protein [Marinilactibacillus psychrotolerans]GEL67972.1 putative ABC transporter extracellular-binding protein YckB [Marinilactibacillus psychrotolerans]GEQ35681.1 amino acid ABC transporter substrate-binding protein [Marinilactibacillus psychrotolerans]SDD29330.1 amino acid ABC transporter substrate-binding protein, PAAT family (TC 3.A.1.3.-) [Marinilactibacillus psychrotolerans]